MANRVVMAACAVIRRGGSMPDVYHEIDGRFGGAPDYVKDEAETRAAALQARLEELAVEAGRRKVQAQRRGHRAKTERFPSRGERRNAMHGRHNTGNTLSPRVDYVPDGELVEGQMTKVIAVDRRQPFRFHPMAPTVRVARGRAERARAMREKQEREFNEVAKHMSSSAFQMAMGVIFAKMMGAQRGR